MHPCIRSCLLYILGGGRVATMKHGGSIIQKSNNPTSLISNFLFSATPGRLWNLALHMLKKVCTCSFLDTSYFGSFFERWMRTRSWSLFSYDIFLPSWFGWNHTVLLWLCFWHGSVFSSRKSHQHEWNLHLTLPPNPLPHWTPKDFATSTLQEYCTPSWKKVTKGGGWIDGVLRRNKCQILVGQTANQERQLSFPSIVTIEWPAFAPDSWQNKNFIQHFTRINR